VTGLVIARLALAFIFGADSAAAAPAARYTYDAADRVTAMTYPNGEVVTTSYNDAMEPRALTSNWGVSYVDDATYTALGQPKLLDLGNGLFTHHTYWGAGLDFTFGGYSTWGRLRAVCVTTQSTPCADAANTSAIRMHIAYAYDNAGNVTAQGDWTTGQHPGYSYDHLDRLTGWTINGATQETFGYDTIGRMTFKTGV
jgi:YD repeat-containing protein